MEKQLLTREQKEAMLLLQIGSFLEYFDLMIYVHMSVLLNELFFPQGDPRTASLLAALAFCGTFIFRPVGALFFGFIGDHLGRKQTIIFTTALMAISCIMMAGLPTYEKIGITAAWLVMLCRALQSISSLGEVVGAGLYLTEIIKPPLQYPIVSSVSIASFLGGVGALAMASFVTTSGYDWRTAFWAGAIIAGVGSAARTKLRETPDFVDMKRKVQRAIEEAKENGVATAATLLSKHNPVWKVKINKVSLFYFFLIFCGTPLNFYFVYVYCANILRNKFGFTPAEVIHQNLVVALIDFVAAVIYAALSYKIHPFKILKVKLWIFVGLVLCWPYALQHASTAYHIFVIQLLTGAFSLDDLPATAILYKNFPVFRRFTCASWVFATSRAFIYVITAFGFVYLTDIFGYWGLWVIALPVCAGFYCGVRYFDRLEHGAKSELTIPGWKISSSQRAA